MEKARRKDGHLPTAAVRVCQNWDAKTEGLQRMRKKYDILSVSPNSNTAFRDISQDNPPRIRHSGKTGEIFQESGKRLDVWHKLKYNVACKDAKG